MLATLIPLFDEALSVKAYSVFSQKTNMFLSPGLLGTGSNDGAGIIPGFEVIKDMGLSTVSEDTNIIIPINGISIFADMDAQYDGPKDRVILLADTTIENSDKYVERVKELKQAGFKLAMRKLDVSRFEEYRTMLSHFDYIFLDDKKIDIRLIGIYFERLLPGIKLVAGNIGTQEDFERVKAKSGYAYYEGSFYRMPVSKGNTKVSQLKTTAIELLNIINTPDFELTDAADVIGRDTALVVELLKIVNRLTVNSEISSIRHATAMLGQRELKRWINTAVLKELGADRPSELTRMSLLRAGFAERLAPLFGLSGNEQEIFLMGLFSILDVMLEMPMRQALETIVVSNPINEALVNHSGKYWPILDFMFAYENADWANVSRKMLTENPKINTEEVAAAYSETLRWYRDIFG